MCINQLDDIQLAIAIARVYGGDDCVELKEILEDIVLPLAAREGNRWLATWAFWMLRRRDKAVRALIVRRSLSHPCKARLTHCPHIVTDPQSPQHTRLAQPAGEILPHERPGTGDLLPTATREDVADLTRRVGDLATSGVGVRGA